MIRFLLNKSAQFPLAGDGGLLVSEARGRMPRMTPSPPRGRGERGADFARVCGRVNNDRG